MELDRVQLQQGVEYVGFIHDYDKSVFAAADVKFCRHLADTAVEDWTDAKAMECHQMLAKYSEQLESFGITYLYDERDFPDSTSVTPKVRWWKRWSGDDNALKPDEEIIVQEHEHLVAGEPATQELPEQEDDNADLYTSDSDAYMATRTLDLDADLKGVDLPNANFIDENFPSLDSSGVKVIECSVSGRRHRIRLRPRGRNDDLSGRSLYQRDLRGADLHQANLSGTDLREADLREADLREANLSEANLSGAVANSLTVWPVGFAPKVAGVIFKNLSSRRRDLREVFFVGENLSWTNLSRTNLTSACLDSASLTGANLAGANLEYVNFSEANLVRANLFRAELAHAVLPLDCSGANFSGANFSGSKDDLCSFSSPAFPCDFSGADFSGANLGNGSFNSANFAGANLNGVVQENTHETLGGLSLAKANFTGADLRGADLTGAWLTGANLTGANLTGANLTDADLTDAVSDDSTVWPEAPEAPQPVPEPPPRPQPPKAPEWNAQKVIIKGTASDR